MVIKIFTIQTNSTMSKTLRRVVVARATAITAGLMLFGALASFAATETERAALAVIDQASKEVLAILRDKSLPHERRIRLLSGVVDAHFDMKTMSRLVLGRNWKRFTVEQRAEYVEQFEEYLSNNYGNRIERYGQETVEILGARDEPRGDVTVITNIKGGETEDVRISYRLRDNGDEWRVIDVSIEGISLVSNFSDQFREVVSKGGPEGLLEKLKEKNSSAESTQTAPPEEPS